MSQVFNKAAFPVDTHIHRCERVWIVWKTDGAAALQACVGRAPRVWQVWGCTSGGRCGHYR